jgi:hypothetical protein
MRIDVRRIATVVVVAALGVVGWYGYALARSTSVSSVNIRTLAAPTTTTIPRSYGGIALVGDSLSVQAAIEEQARLRQAGWDPVTHNAQFGRRIPWDAKTLSPFSGIAAVNDVRATSGDAHTWIIELGTNDVVVTHDDAGSIRTLIDAMLAVIGPGHRIVWVNVHNGFDPASSATFNGVLAQVASERTDMVVADWATAANDPGNLMPQDHVHLTPAGQVAFAAVIARAADRAAALP